MLIDWEFTVEMTFRGEYSVGGAVSTLFHHTQNHNTDNQSGHYPFSFHKTPRTNLTCTSKEVKGWQSHLQGR